MAFNPETGLMHIPTTYSSYPFVAEAGAKMGNQLLSDIGPNRPCCTNWSSAITPSLPG